MAYVKDAKSNIKHRRDFKVGNFWGAVVTPELKRRISTGELPEQYREMFVRDTEAMTYVIFSYETPIAWEVTHGLLHSVTIPAVRYSATTTRHQNIVREIIGAEREHALV